MPAVRTVLRLFDLDEADGKITALDSYGADTHVGTSRGQLIRLTTSPVPATQSQTVASVLLYSGQATSSSAAAPSDGAKGGTSSASSPDETAVFTKVARRCTVSASGAAVQQLQHSRSQRLLFVLCGGVLQLLHADTYAVLSTIAAEVASFSVAPPLSVVGCGASGSVKSDTNVSPAAGTVSSTHARVCTGCLTSGENNGCNQYSSATSHSCTPSQGSHGSSSARTPGGALVAAPSASLAGCAVNSASNAQQYHGNAHDGRDCRGSGAALSCSLPYSSLGGGRAYVVCVAEKHKKQLSVYVVDRVSTSVSAAVSALAPCVNEPAEDGGLGCSTSLSSPTVRSALPPPPPRVMLRQCYVLPELAQCVLLSNPAPGLHRGPGLPYAAAVGAPTGDGLLPVAGSVEAGLSVCVGMRREVSLLSLLGGSPWCVLRLDGSRPPLLSVGSDNNTFLVRTQAPNTVMEVGVPPAAATAGCVHIGDGGWRTGAAVASATVQGSASRGKNNELVMGDVFQADAPVELVLARFPHVFLFTAQHCNIVSLLEDGSGTGVTWKSQRIPLQGVRYGALRGQGMSVCVASDRTVWMLQISPLRAQLAEMVAGGNSEGAFQLVAHHRRRASGTARNVAAAIDTDDALRSLEAELHRMAGFVALHRGEVAKAIRYLRGYVDPREVLLTLSACTPPTANRATTDPGAGAAIPQGAGLDVYVLDHVVSISSVDKYCELLRQGTVSPCVKASSAEGTAVTPLPSYWDGWQGPCVYNSFAGDVAEAWRAAFATSSSLLSSTGSVEDFVARCFDLLKKEVRTWFAEELFDPSSSGSVVSSGPVSLEAGPRTFTQLEGLECSGASRPTAPATLSSTALAAQRRAMEYASLVLAWEARDYRTAYRVVASLSQAVLVQDCADMLKHRREYRLLALLQFRAGFGEACCSTLRNAVSLSAVLRQRHGHAAVQTAPVSSQMGHWRRCMATQISNGEGSAVSAPQPPTCGSGLLMLPSPTEVARVAYTLFNIESLFGFASDAVATEALLEGVASYYAAHHFTCPNAGTAAATAGHSETNFCELRFSRCNGQTSHLFAFPHAGPVLLPPEAPAPLPQDTAVECHTGAASELRVTGSGRSPVRVMPSALTSFFYLVEKLDVVGVRHLLSHQPRLAQLRDEEGSTALHIAFSQLSLICLPRTCAGHAPSSQALATAQMPALQLLCALNGLLVHFGCPVGALNVYGWSCLDVAAVACAGNTTAFDVVTAALMASVEVHAVV